ncbi:MAG: hypothetical protein WD065_06410, partial [Planctomycetaceae bacterium]
EFRAFFAGNPQFRRSIALTPQGQLVGGQDFVVRRQRQFMVEIVDDAILVDGVSVLAKQAGTQYDVMVFLWEEFRNNLAASTSVEDFEWFSVGQIADGIVQRRRKVAIDDLANVRRAIARLQDNMRQTILRQTGTPISQSDIVEGAVQSGASDQEGYRINPRTVLPRPKQTPTTRTVQKS